MSFDTPTFARRWPCVRVTRETWGRAILEGALTVRLGMTNRAIYAVDIAADLRAAFCIDEDTVWTVAIGTHDIYRG